MTNRTITASALLLLGALALAGCATTPGAAPGPADTAGSSPAEESELDAAWLSGGTAIGLVTFGSSTCQPIVGEATASGQTVTVELTEPEAAACTRDYVPRASYVPLPEGVDASLDVELVVTGAYRGDTDLDALAGELPPASGDDPMVDMQSSAGWFDDGGLVLLTYGSSSCPPVFESVAVGAEGTVDAVIAEPAADQVCTADFAPRLSVLQVEVDDDARPAELVISSPWAEGVEPERVAILG